MAGRPKRIGPLRVRLAALIKGDIDCLYTRLVSEEIGEFNMFLNTIMEVEMLSIWAMDKLSKGSLISILKELGVRAM